ncbi:hypothetical protein BC827DRAFT_674898 [Russula dissimulans]|nr:hypothetical protein BC827DRAFT_674898 [Russula dissimulans]
MSNHTKALPPIPQTHLGPGCPSFDVGEISSSHSHSSSTPSTPSTSSEDRSSSLRSSSSLRITPATANVKFAPLPQIGPRTRGLSRPLGVAARSALLQQRTNARIQGVPRHPRGWTDPDGRPVAFIPNEMQDEDPLEVLGRFIADKSKSLWRRLSSNGKRSDKDEAMDGVSETTTDGEGRKVVQPRPPKRKEVRSRRNGAREISINNSSPTVEISSQTSSQVAV